MFIKLIIFPVLLHTVFSQRQNLTSLLQSFIKPSPDCVVPSLSLENGNLKFIALFQPGSNSSADPVEGDRVASYFVRASCNPGFQVVGTRDLVCPDKITDSKKAAPAPPPQCLPICKQENPEVLTCGASSDNEVSRCVIPDDGFGFSSLSSKKRKNLQCGVANTVSASVAGGRKAGQTDVPWHVSVYTKKTQPFMQTCGGTLVSAKLVVSAAHCFWSDLTKQQPAADYAVAVAKLYRPWNDENDVNAQKSDVQEIRIPPRFQGGATNFQDDIALLITTNAFQFNSFVTPACLDFDYNFDTTQTADGNLARVAGFGLTGQDAGASPVLNMVEMPTVGIEKCISSSDPGFLVSITSDKICAGFRNGTAVCRGDSGGGLAVPSEGEDSFHYFLRGVVSSAPKNDHSCNVFALATFTHLIKHEHFIKQALADAANIKTSQSVTAEPSFGIGAVNASKQPAFGINLPVQNEDDGLKTNLETTTEYVYPPILINTETGQRFYYDNQKPNATDSSTTTQATDANIDADLQEIFVPNNSAEKTPDVPTADTRDTNAAVPIAEVEANPLSNNEEIPLAIPSTIITPSPISNIEQTPTPITSVPVQNLPTAHPPYIPAMEPQNNGPFYDKFNHGDHHHSYDDKGGCHHDDYEGSYHGYHHGYHYDHPHAPFHHHNKNYHQYPQFGHQNVQPNQQNAQSQFGYPNGQLGNQNAQIGQFPQLSNQNVDFNQQDPQISRSKPQNTQSSYQETQFSHLNGQNGQSSSQNVDFLHQNAQISQQNAQNTQYEHQNGYNYHNPYNNPFHHGHFHGYY